MKALLQILRVLNIKIETHKVFSNALYDITELIFPNRYQYQKCIGQVEEICQYISHQPVSVFPLAGQLTICFEIPKQEESISKKEVSEIWVGKRKDDTMNLSYLAGYDIYQQVVMMDLNAVSNLMVVASSEKEVSHYVGGALKQICNTLGEELFKVGYIGCHSNGIQLHLPGNSWYRGPKNRFGQCREPILGKMTQVVDEIETRYHILLKRRVKSLPEYNKKAVFKLPHLCFVIYDYVELINKYGTEFTSLLGRIAILGRLTGVHIIIATTHGQREENSVFINENFHDRFIIDNKHLSYLSGVHKKGQIMHLRGNGDLFHIRTGDGVKARVQRLYYPMGF